MWNVSERRRSAGAFPLTKRGMIIKGTWKSTPNVVEYYMCVRGNNQLLWACLSEGTILQSPEPWDDSPARFPEAFKYIGTVKGPVTLSAAEEE